MDSLYAFPQPIQKLNFDTRPEDFKETGCCGMTLRDYFAAKALQGILASDTNQTINQDKAAEWAYNQANAMLAERAKYAS